MARRSTRNKIRFQLEQVVKKLGGCQVHLKYADDLARDEHPRLSAALPDIVSGVQTIQDTVLVLRDLI